MLPRFTARGAAALGNIITHSGKLKVFEGVPAPYDTKKRLVVPDALKIVRLKNYRKFCNLGDLASEVGWSKKNLIEKLEDNRRARALTWHKKRQELAGNVRKSQNAGEIAKIRTELSQYGY
jgi:large subunit ribosomal protein L13Ae